MAAVYDRQNAGELLPSEHFCAEWTVVIAAAGRGTRLDFDKPKILFPVNGVTILERLCRLFDPFCEEFVFVLSPSGSPEVEPNLNALLPGRSRIVIQPSPLGMGDAIACALPALRTEFTAVVWGDQFALKPASLDFCMRLLKGGGFEAVCPTILRSAPYIHFERDPVSGRVISVLQQREGDVLPEVGESDSGVFFFQTDALGNYLPRMLDTGECIGRRTGERNFLPLFPWIDAQQGRLALARIMSEVESIGVNTRQDAECVAALTTL